MSAPVPPPRRMSGDEIFAQIPGFPGYFIGDRGTVISARRRGRMCELRPLVKTNGYASVNLRELTTCQKTVTVHPLVAEAFIGPRPSQHLALHWDGSRTNNDVRNLRWGTHAENAQDAIRHGALQSRAPRGKSRRAIA